jgi:signal transduction histidine kinase
VIGIVRLTHELAGVYERFLNLRFWIGGVVVVELLIGVVLGFILALSLERYLRRVTDSLYNIATGQPIPPLPQQGPEEVRTLFQAVNTLASRLQTLEDARRRLLANLVHELGRPLGALRSAVHALLHGAERDPELRQELLKGMEAEILRLQPLLDNLAQLHGQILGTLELDRRLVVTSRWLSLVARPWQAAAEEKGLRWQIDIPLGLPPVSIDANQMAQVIGNLLSNAVKYTPTGGLVCITAFVENEALQIQDTDTGTGIVPEELGRIFEPFHRSQTGRRFPQGMGLGLTIAQDIIIAHGGQLNVESTPGEGSRFTVILPLTEAETSLSPP